MKFTKMSIPTGKKLEDSKVITFDDLVFIPHNVTGFDKQALVLFPNGYGLSVITGRNAYSSEDKPYEVGVIKSEVKPSEIITGTRVILDDYKFELNYELTNGDVLGYQTKEDINKLLIKVQHINGEKLELSDIINPDASGSYTVMITFDDITNLERTEIFNALGKVIKDYKAKNNSNFTYDLVSY